MILGLTQSTVKSKQRKPHFPTESGGEMGLDQPPLLSLTPRSVGWGTERLQNMETVLPAQVCAKPHAPDDHRSREGILQVNIFKRNPLFPGRVCSPNTMYFNVYPSGLQKAVITVQMLGFFKAKSLTGTVMVSPGCQLGWASLQ